MNGLQWVSMWYNELVSHGGWQGRKDKAMIGLAVKVAKSKAARKVAKVAVKKAAEHVEVKLRVSIEAGFEQVGQLGELRDDVVELSDES